jgi:hypothetical protein
MHNLVSELIPYSTQPHQGSDLIEAETCERIDLLNHRPVSKLI